MTRRPGRPAHRRASGEGSIYEETLPDGQTRFVGSISIGSGEHRKRPRVTGPTRKAVAEKLKHLAERARANTLFDDPITVAQLAERWWEIQRYTIEESTQVVRRVRMQKHLIDDPIGAMRIAELRPRHVSAWLARKANTGYERYGKQYQYKFNTLRDMRADLHLLMEWAVAEDWVDRRNPAKYAKIPMKVPRREIKRTLTPEQAMRLIHTCQTTELAHGNLILVSLLTGCRPGEIAAITDADVDYVNHTLHIRRAIKRGNNGAAIGIGETKDHHDRIFEVSDTVLDAIRQERINTKKKRLAAGPRWSGEWNDLIFLTLTGRPLTGGGLITQVRRIAGQAGIEFAADLDPYELRHSFISLARKAGKSIEDIIAQVGHRDDRMYWGTYFHRTDPVVRIAGAVEGLDA